MIKYRFERCLIKLGDVINVLKSLNHKRLLNLLKKISTDLLLSKTVKTLYGNIFKKYYSIIFIIKIRFILVISFWLCITYK